MTASATIAPDEIDAGFVPVPGASVYAVAVDGEALLLDEARERLHLLNLTGAIVWASFDGQTSLGRIAAELGTELGVDSGTVLVDSVALARRLGEAGLLRNVEAAEDPVPEIALTREADRDCVDEPGAASTSASEPPPDPRFVPEPPSP